MNMSFSQDIKRELMAQQTQKKCCRRALSAGLLFDAEADGKDHIKAYFNSSETAKYAVKIFATAFGPQNVEEPQKVNKQYCVMVNSPSATDLIGTVCDYTCAECRQNFLKGLLISTASITDPDKQYHCEFSIKESERVPILSDELSEMFKRPIIISRKNATGLVYKNSAVIEDILSYIGATQTYFSMINAKIENDLRNSANRATNCETHNIALSVKAGAVQTEAIEYIISADELKNLPAELRETAELRLLYQDLPLSELAARHCPPLTKSGINHRIKRLIDIAETLKNKNERR